MKHTTHTRRGDNCSWFDLYCLCRLTASASAFFQYALVAWVFCIVFISIGQLVVALMPSVDVTQAVVG